MGKTALHHSLITLLLLLVVSPLAATVDVITTGERFEEMQLISQCAAGTSCTAAFVGHVCRKPGDPAVGAQSVITMCTEWPSTGVYAYVPLSGVLNAHNTFDYGSSVFRGRDAFFGRDASIVDLTTVPPANESLVSLLIESRATDADATPTGIVFHGGRAASSATAPLNNRGVIRPSRNVIAGNSEDINLGSFDFPFQHVYLDSAGEIFQGAGAEPNFHLAANGSLQSDNNPAKVQYPSFEIYDDGGTTPQSNLGVESNWFPEDRAGVAGHLCADSFDLGRDPAVSTPEEHRWRDLWVCRDAAIAGNLTVSGTITGATDCLTSATGPTTLCLTQAPASNQTLTGNTGDLTVTPTSGLILNSNEAQASTATAHIFNDLVGNGAAADRTAGYYARFNTFTGSGAFAHNDYALGVSAQAAPKIIAGPAAGVRTSWMDFSTIGVGDTIDGTTGLPTGTATSTRWRIITSSTAAQVDGSVRDYLTNNTSSVASGLIAFRFTQGAQTDQQFRFEYTSGTSEAVGTTIPLFRFNKESPFAGTGPFMRFTWDDSGGTQRTWMEMGQTGQFGLKDTSAAFLANLIYTSSPAFTANRNLTVDLNDGSRTVNLGGNVTFPSGSAYTITNVTTDRSYDANATSLDELADVLGTLIADLQAAGVIP